MIANSRLKQIKEMLEQEPGDIFLNYALALELASHENTFADAEIQFKKTLELNPSYVPAFYQLGKLYELLQKNDLALLHYQKGLAFAREQKNYKAINEIEEAIFMLE